MDRLVCALISVLCSYDIVKRVVTVKQVRPSFLINSGGVRSGLGMGMCLPMRERRRGAVVCAQFPRSESGERRSEEGSGVPAFVSDLCALRSDLCTAFWGYRPCGLLEPDARAGGWARARHDKGIW
jgi:hypothetical protein